ncbi:hypothetical protein [Marinicellulosiphila megalodicopiae]|uniref:hypothetical protein n=1 Tax=Marinicellulosiphila megalodicopiae TaxID=2724896 RepID=UPI003BAE8FD3
MNENKESNDVHVINDQPKTQILKQMYSRMVFMGGAVLGAIIAYFTAHTLAVGVMFGGAAALTLTTIFAKNKSFNERWILGGAMFVFFVTSFIGYLVYRA